MPNKDTKALIEEARERHREVKRELLEILGRAENQNLTREVLLELIFKLYLKVK